MLIARGGRTATNQYHLAAALARAGRNAEAGETLDALLDDFADFPERSSALALARSIGAPLGED